MDHLPLALFVVGMAIEAYFLPWLFVAHIAFFLVFRVTLFVKDIDGTGVGGE